MEAGYFTVFNNKLLTINFSYAVGASLARIPISMTSQYWPIILANQYI